MTDRLSLAPDQALKLCKVGFDLGNHVIGNRAARPWLHFDQGHSLKLLISWVRRDIAAHMLVHNRFGRVVCHQFFNRRVNRKRGCFGFAVIISGEGWRGDECKSKTGSKSDSFHISNSHECVDDLSRFIRINISSAQLCLRDEAGAGLCR